MRQLQVAYQVPKQGPQGLFGIVMIKTPIQIKINTKIYGRTDIQVNGNSMFNHPQAYTEILAMFKITFKESDTGSKRKSGIKTSTKMNPVNIMEYETVIRNKNYKFVSLSVCNAE